MDAAAKKLAAKSEKFHAFEWLKAQALAGNKHAITFLTEDTGILAEMKKVGADEVMFGPVPELKGRIPIVMYFETGEQADEFIALVRQGNPNLKGRRLR